MERLWLRATIAGTRRATAFLIALSVLPGCASSIAPTQARMTAEEARAEFGALGVATVGRTPELHVGRPETSRWEAAKEGALAGFCFFLGCSKDLQSLILGFAYWPLTAPVGAIYGALAAQTREEVERAVSTMEAAAREANVQQRLRDLVIAHLDREHYGGVLPVDETATASLEIETVVHVWINDIFVIGAEGFEFAPKLTLSLVGEMRLLKKGIEVRRLRLVRPFAPPFGKARTLPAWAADDAQSFKKEIAVELAKFAGEVVSELLSRPAPEQAERYRRDEMRDALTEGEPP